MMSDTQSSPGNRRALPPMGVEAPVREPARQSARTQARPYQPPEPHEKFFIPPEDIPEGMDAFWLPVTIAGQPSDKVGEYYRAGWMPAEAKDFPLQSGYGTEYPEQMIRAGLLKNTEANEPVIKDGLMLVLRPRQMSAQAHHARESAANEQVRNQMQRLNQAYRSARGVGVRRSHAPMPDMQPAMDEE